MEETRERELLGACAAADCVGTLNNEDPPTRSRQLDGGGKPVRSGTNNNGIKSSHPRIMASFGQPTRGLALLVEAIPDRRSTMRHDRHPACSALSEERTVVAPDGPLPSIDVSVPQFFRTRSPFGDEFRWARP